MAKIKIAQAGGAVTVTRDGATRRTYIVTGEGVLTCRKGEVTDVLSALPGSTLVDGTADEPDTDRDETANVTTPPNLPPPPKPGK